MNPITDRDGYNPYMEYDIYPVGHTYSSHNDKEVKFFEVTKELHESLMGYGHNWLIDNGYVKEIK